MIEKITFHEYYNRIKNIRFRNKLIDEKRNLLEGGYYYGDEKTDAIRYIENMYELNDEEAERINLVDIRTLDGRYFPQELSKALDDYDTGKASWDDVMAVCNKLNIQ